ncbi:hypothetical protein H4R34_004545 [Dimargaris verticillata]|uniref:PH domain-containing protein n=1 Tax=Dimargaris verticillata TaxID=2761393 RepID=A0A9W8AYQ3_9FUNG|nr:hypothetical protein H4R34_004545 [Dimargaris verticillata]
MALDSPISHAYYHMPCTLSSVESVARAVQPQPAPHPIAHWTDDPPSSSDSETDLEPAKGVATIAGGIASAWTKKPRFFRVSRRSRQSPKTRHNHPVVFHRSNTGIAFEQHGDGSVSADHAVVVTIGEPIDTPQQNSPEAANQCTPGTVTMSASEWLAEQGCVLDHPTTLQSKMYVYNCDTQGWGKRSITLNRQVLSCVNKAGQAPQGSRAKLKPMEAHAFPLPFPTMARRKTRGTRLHSLPVSGSDESCDHQPSGPAAGHLQSRPSHPNLLSSLSPPPSPPPMVSSTSLPSFEAVRSLRRRREVAMRTQPQQRKAAKLRQDSSPSATVCIHPPDWLCHVSMIHSIRFTPEALVSFRGLKLHTFEIITNDDRTFRLATRKRSHHFRWLTTLLANWDTSCGQGKLTVPALTPEASPATSSCASLNSLGEALSDPPTGFSNSPNSSPASPSLLSALPVASEEPVTTFDQLELPLPVPPSHRETSVPGLADQGLTFGQIWRQAMVDAVLCDDQIRIGTVAPTPSHRSSYQALMDYSVGENDAHIDSSPHATTASISPQQKPDGFGNGLAAMRLSTFDQTPLTELMETVDAADIIHIYESLGLASPKFMDCSAVPLSPDTGGAQGYNDPIYQGTGRRPLTVHYNHEHHQSLFHRAHLIQPNSDSEVENSAMDDEGVTGLNTYLFGILHSPGELSDTTATAADSPQGPQVVLDSGATVTLPSPIQTTFNLVCEAETPTTAVSGSLSGLRTKRKFSLPVEYSPVFLPYANGWRPWDLDTIAEETRGNDSDKPTSLYSTNQVPRLDVELNDIDGLSFSELVKSSTDSIFKTTDVSPLLPDQFAAPLDRNLQRQRLQEWQQEACQVVEETTSTISALTLTNIPAPDKRAVYRAQVPDFKKQYVEANRLKMEAKRNMAQATKPSPQLSAALPPTLALPNQQLPLLLNQTAVPSNVARRQEHEKTARALASAAQGPSSSYGCQPLVSWIPGTKTASATLPSSNAQLSALQPLTSHPTRSHPTYLQRAPAKPLCLDMELIQRKNRRTQHRVEPGIHHGSPKHVATKLRSPKGRSPRHPVFANNASPANHTRRQSANMHHGSRGQPMVPRKNSVPMPKATTYLSYRSPLAMHGYSKAALVSPRTGHQSSNMLPPAHRLPAHHLEMVPPPVPPTCTKPKRFTATAYPMKPLPST